MGNKEHKTIDLSTPGENRLLRQWHSTKASCSAVQGQRISVMVKGEQCANNWKNLEEKHKKVKEHSPKTGKEKENCEFEDERVFPK